MSNGRTSTSIVYGALDLEQRIDTADDVDRDRGERDLLFAGGLAARILDDQTCPATSHAVQYSRVGL
jgi:hypothetical protein